MFVVAADWLTLVETIRIGIASADNDEFADPDDLLAALERDFCQRKLASRNQRRMVETVNRVSTGCCTVETSGGGGRAL